MKKQIYTIVTMLILAITLAVSSAQAQSGRQVRMKIPFDFTVGRKTFRAGEYTFARSTMASTAGLLVRSVDGRAGEMILTHSVEAGTAQAAETKLVFHRYAGQYYLAQVWTSADKFGLALNMSRRERALQRELARTTYMERQMVVIVARQT